MSNLTIGQIVACSSHMALKLGKALGANVTLFTRSPGKEQDARRLGADRVVLSTDAKQMDAVSGQFDLIIDTIPYVHDVNTYMPTLATNDTLVPSVTWVRWSLRSTARR